MLQRRSVHSVMSLASADDRTPQLFTPLALYQGKLVAVKRVTKRAAVQLTKPRLIELKQVRNADVTASVTGVMISRRMTFLLLCLVQTYF